MRVVILGMFGALVMSMKYEIQYMLDCIKDGYEDDAFMWTRRVYQSIREAVTE